MSTNIRIIKQKAEQLCMGEVIQYPKLVFVFVGCLEGFWDVGSYINMLAGIFTLGQHSEIRDVGAQTILEDAPGSSSNVWNG